MVPSGACVLGQATPEAPAGRRTGPRAKNHLILLLYAQGWGGATKCLTMEWWLHREEEGPPE